MPLCQPGESIDSRHLDRVPFQFRHGFQDHPALTHQSLVEVLPALPPDQVMYSSRSDDLAGNLDTAHIDHRNGLSLEETIENIRTSNSYIAVKRPETHPVFRELADELTSDIGRLMQERGTGRSPTELELWLFIASPEAVTPFHFDRYSNFLFQIRGSKEVAVFEPWNSEVIEQVDYEAYVAHEARRMHWHDDKDRFAHKFHMEPGQAVHIPFLGGHYVKNGKEDVSITMSVFFHNDETTRWSRALLTNHFLRKRLRPLRVTPRPIRASHGIDSVKAHAYPMIQVVGRGLRRLGLRG